MYSERFWKKNWDDGVRDLDPEEFETTYVALVKKSINAVPDKAALAYMGREITYRELDQFSNQFANMLLQNGLKKGDVVGIHLPNIPQYLISVIGTLKAGCIVSGISPLLPPDQMKYQLKDLSGSGKKTALVTMTDFYPSHVAAIAADLPLLKLVVTTHPAAMLPVEVPKAELAPLADKTVLDYTTEVLASYSTDDPNVSLSPDDLGWLQYTGGTTGPPKGVMLNHRNACHNIQGFMQWYGLEPGAGVMLSGFPMFHIAGLTVTEASFALGWTQILIPNPRDTDHMCAEIEKYKPDVMINVPSLFQLLTADPKFKEIDFSNLKTCISAASPYPKESQKEFSAIVGEGKLSELYGMTETSPIATMNPARGLKKLGSIGLPMQNNELKIIDPEVGRELPIGEPGELCIKGPLVMQGYFNKPEETRKAVDADGFMHTGDVGYMDEDGYIFLVDRTKDMINVGGFKVFSSKVEDILSNHPAVGVIVLIGIPNPERPGSELVKAFIQLDPAFDFDGNEEALKADFTTFAKQYCAPYEVPKVIEFVQAIPMTAVGKIDKKSLRN